MMFPWLLFVSILLPGFAISRFDPDVRWSCSDTAFSIFVRTKSPFDGIIAPSGISTEDCITRGIGTNLAVLQLYFDRKDCGITYNEEDDRYSVSIDIHSHPILIVDQDKSINISCRAITANTSNGSSAASTSLFSMQLLNQEEVPTSAAYYSAPYFLRVTSANDEQFTVGKCTANAGESTTVELTDSRGCTLFPSLISNFNRSSSSMTSYLPSMFRFPSSEEITITCRILPCEGKCEVSSCVFEESSSIFSILNESTTVEVEPEGQTVSVNFTVIDRNQKGTETVKDGVGSIIGPMATEKSTTETGATSTVRLSTQSSSLSEPFSDSDRFSDENECARPADLDLLYSLCIVLTVFSTVAFSMNIVFCCIIWRRRKAKGSEARLRPQKPAATANSEFWIMDSAKPVADVSGFDSRRMSNISYASVKKQYRAPAPIVEYGMPPASRSSDSSSGYGEQIYRRPDVRPTSFMTPSTTMETDLDSSISSNQASSYH